MILMKYCLFIVIIVFPLFFSNNAVFKHPFNRINIVTVVPKPQMPKFALFQKITLSMWTSTV